MYTYGRAVGYYYGEGCFPLREFDLLRCHDPSNPRNHGKVRNVLRVSCEKPMMIADIRFYIAPVRGMIKLGGLGPLGDDRVVNVVGDP